jgi:pyruvate kinase
MTMLSCPGCRTKIVCTLGPSTDVGDTLSRLIQAGMSVARINFSHGTQAENGRRMRECREQAAAAGTPVSLLADLQGPKWRIGRFSKGKVQLQPGQEFSLVLEPILGDAHRVHLPHPDLFAAIEEGDHILLGDGDLELIARHKSGSSILCEVLVGGTLASNKGITVPGRHLPVAPITAKDKADLSFALQVGVDMVAMSFVQRGEDVEQLRALCREAGGPLPSIVAKIETRAALDNFEAVLNNADAIMVARGDLGLEVSPEEVPLVQKDIIKRCRSAGKPVITATQMLESMMANPRPTRAEASDVANAILDGTDAVMLSGETATGRYPVLAVEMMRRIAAYTEAHLPHSRWLQEATSAECGSITEAISLATVEIAAQVAAKAIVAATISGWTVRMVAKFRPSTPLVAATPSPATVRQLMLVWGVVPVLVPEFRTTDEMTSAAVGLAAQVLGLAAEDVVVVTAGVPLGGSGRTNMIRVHRVEEVVR